MGNGVVEWFCVGNQLVVKSCDFNTASLWGIMALIGAMQPLGLCVDMALFLALPFTAATLHSHSNILR